MPENHRIKLARRGNEIPIYLTEAQQQHFWLHIEEAPSGCWEWAGHLIDHGYGMYRVGPRTKLRAHRIAWTLVNGPIANGLTLDHLCRNRLCVNPAHLEAVTNAENILRGASPTACNALKTHCPHGHEYTEENTLRRRGKRECWQCRKDKRKRLKKWGSGKHRPRVSVP